MTDAPDLTIHRAVHVDQRRAVHDLAAAVADLDLSDRRRLTALTRWWRGQAREAVLHRSAEDDHFFPALVDRVPSAVALLARADADHVHLDELLTGVGEALEALRAEVMIDAGGAGAVAARERASSLVAELARDTGEHLDLEDAEILPLLGTHLGADEFAAIEFAAKASASADSRSPRR